MFHNLKCCTGDSVFFRLVWFILSYLYFLTFWFVVRLCIPYVDDQRVLSQHLHGRCPLRGPLFPDTLAAVFAGHSATSNVALIVCSSRIPTPGQLSNREKTDVQHQQWWWGQRRNKPPASSNMVFKTSWQPWSVTVWPLTFLGGGFICSSGRTGARKKAFPGWGNGYSNPLTVTNIKSKFPQLVLTWCRRSSRVKK